MIERMMPVRDLRAFSRAMLGLMLFLLFTAHVALPCMVGSDPSLASGSVQMCREPMVFKSITDTNQLFTATIPAPARAAAIVFTAALLSALFVSVKKPPADILRRWRFLFWLKSKSRPFSEAARTFLPRFAALRDA